MWWDNEPLTEAQKIKRELAFKNSAAIRGISVEELKANVAAFNRKNNIFGYGNE